MSSRAYCCGLDMKSPVCSPCYPSGWCVELVMLMRRGDFQRWSLVGVSQCSCVLGDCAALGHSWSVCFLATMRRAASAQHSHSMRLRYTPQLIQQSLNGSLSSNKLSFSIVSLRHLMSAMKSSLAQGSYKSQYLTVHVSSVGLHTFSLSNSPGSRQPCLA